MGSSQSHMNRKYGSIYIQTDQPSYNPGQVVSGFIGLNMHTPFPASTLFLKIKGEEKVKFVESEQRSYQVEENGQSVTKNETIYHHRKGKQEFFKQQIPIQSFCGQFIPFGQYQIPFQFMLPNHLPGSFKAEGHDHDGKFEAKIQYSVKAYAYDGCSSNSWFKIGKDKQISYKQHMTIKEPLKYVGSQQQGHMTQKMSTWCCLDKGQSSIKTYFEKNVYTIGETANICSEIDNSRCELSINTITTHLNSVITLKDTHGHHKQIHRSLLSFSFPGLGFGQTAIGNDMRIHSVHLVQHEDWNTRILPSTTGNLIQSENFLKVKTHFEGCTCCVTQPEVQIPVQIYFTDPSNYGQYVTPQDWNPQVYDVQNIQFGQEYQYGNQSYCQQSYQQSSQMQPNMNSNFNYPVQNQNIFNTNMNQNNQPLLNN